MDPWKSWAIFGLVGGGVAYYYTQQSRKSKQGRGRTSTRQVNQEQRQGSESLNNSKDARKRKGKGKAVEISDRAGGDVADVSSASSPVRSADTMKKRKGGKQQPSKLANSSTVEANHDRDGDHRSIEDDGEISNNEFAKKLSSLKIGTSLKKPETVKNPTKTSKKQTTNKELPSEAVNDNHLKPNEDVAKNLSTASSTTGADADDDLSLPVSPNIGAAQVIMPSGGDVSDMLESPTNGPSVLNVVQTTNPQSVKQPKQQKKTAEPETKKQRQKRQKNEERKALREEAEKERRVLLEKQLRTAREAEGRPAKNGMTGSTKPPINAWDKNVGLSATKGASTTSEAPATSHGSLLDTFDEEKSFLGQGAAQVNGGPHEIATEGRKVWDRELPSEEEQMKLITEMDDDDTWNTVTKGGKGKKHFAKVSPNETNSSGFHRKNLTSKTARDIPQKKADSHSTDTASSKGEHDGTSKGIHIVNHEDLNASLANTSSNSGSDKTDTSSITSASERSKYEGPEIEQRSEGAEERPFWKDPNYQGPVPPYVSKQWREIAKGLDRSVWNHQNIKEHPDFEPSWPFALLGHPLDSDWAGDWDAEDLRKGNEKREREEAAQKAKQ